MVARSPADLRSLEHVAEATCPVTRRPRRTQRPETHIRTRPAGQLHDPQAVVSAATSTGWDWVISLACALATLAAFWPTLGHQFVDWDDDRNLVYNPEFRGLGWHNLSWMLTSTMMGHWIPFTWITFGADYLVWGMNPRGYHLTNLMLHASAAMAAYFVALRLLRSATGVGQGARRLGASAAALFFAIHPMRVESVAWVTERRDVLSGLWFLLTILTYLVAADAVGARRRRWLAVSVGAYALAVTAKATVMTLPAVLIVLDLYPLRRLGTRWREWVAPETRHVWTEKIPFLLIGLGAAGMAIHALRSFGQTLASPAPLESRMAVALHGLWFYVWKTFMPWSISPLYQLPDHVDPLDPAMVASAAAVLALTACLLWMRQRWPAGLAVWISYVVLLAPVSGIVQSGPQLVAARYSYLACLGWAFLVGGALSFMVGRASSGRHGLVGPGVTALAAAACFVGLGVLSWRYTWIWQDSETLWSHVVSVQPASSIGHNNLGFAYLNRGQLDSAEREIRTSIRLDPEWELAQTNLAAVLARQGRLKEAGEARAQLGSLLLKHRKYTVAVDLFQREVTARPGDAAAHNNLGAAFLMQGDVGLAIEQFEQALQIDPGHERARRNLTAARQRR